MALIRIGRLGTWIMFEPGCDAARIVEILQGRISRMAYSLADHFGPVTDEWLDSQRETISHIRRAEMSAAGLPAAEAMAILTNAFNDLAPPFAVFGETRDELDDDEDREWGYWRDHDAIEAAQADGRLIVIGPDDEWPADEVLERPGLEGVLVDKDGFREGTLYAPDGTILWWM